MSRSRYRAAIIGLGRMGSTFDDEKERFSRWSAPHAHAACYRAAGVRLAIGASRSWDATYNRMRELIELGEIGDVLHVTGFGRCTLSSNGSHLLTLVAYLAGGPLARCAWVFGQMESDALAAG